MAADDDFEKESLKDEFTHLLEESRMVLPGVQALFGFQLVAVFNDEFTNLEQRWQLIHLAAIMLVTLAIVLIMTPAAYHRIAERGIISRRLSDLGSKLLAAAMLPFAVAIALDVMLITHMVIDSTALEALAFIVALAVSMTAWFVFPLSVRRPHRRRT